MPCVVFTSAYFGRLPWYLVVLLLGLALVGATVVVRLKTVRDEPQLPAESDQPASASTDTTAAVAVIPAAAISSTEGTPHASAR